MWLVWMSVAVFKEVKGGSGNNGEKINGGKGYEGSKASEEGVREIGVHRRR